METRHPAGDAWQWAVALLAAEFDRAPAPDRRDLIAALLDKADSPARKRLALALADRAGGDLGPYLPLMFPEA